MESASSSSASSSVSSTLTLSRLRLNSLRPEAQSDLADCQRMHSRLLSAFPDDAELDQARAYYGLLYRVEWAPAGQSGEVIVLTQSRAEPDWSRLPSGYLVTPAEVKSLAALYEQLREGMALRFRLHANPTRRIRVRNQQETEQWRGKRVNLRSAAEQLDWLSRKGEASGFTVLAAQTRRFQPPELRVPEFQLSELRLRSGERRHPATHAVSVSGLRAGTGALTFGSVVFDGQMRVTDLTRFRDALEMGIGTGKAYGFGLLSIAPGR
ncbi:MAG TPA: type I-E CRISPR-associated protein Cas6/Cse3/CasE [Ktedonobacterales bacterium]|jgi:CRISPR system Cascade subunit CasE|nr:type I-E CRISPR-associated protein Cas6/Cse3/CasE [Ktedonobacterales bacterium]